MSTENIGDYTRKLMIVQDIQGQQDEWALDKNGVLCARDVISSGGCLDPSSVLKLFERYAESQLSPEKDPRLVDEFTNLVSRIGLVLDGEQPLWSRQYKVYPERVEGLKLRLVAIQGSAPDPRVPVMRAALQSALRAMRELTPKDPYALNGLALQVVQEVGVQIGHALTLSEDVQ